MRIRVPMGSRQRRSIVAVASLLMTASLLIATPSSSAPGDIPPPKSISNAEGVVTMSQGAVARKSKLYLTIGGPKNPMWALAYTGLKNTPVEAPETYARTCLRTLPCQSDPFYQPACATADHASRAKSWYFQSAVYPVGHSASRLDPGLVANIPVQMVAFGSIPATATLTMRLPRVGGKLKPLIVHQWGGYIATAMARSCDLTFQGDQYPASTYVEGEVTLTLSNLRVDGVPVDVSSSCRTERPVQLALWNDGNYAPNTGGNLGAFDGLHPGSLGPLDSPYYFHLNGKSLPASTGVTVPPFTGCVGNGDDISPLVTAMASGPNNPVRVTQSRLYAHDEGIDVNDIGKCVDGGCPGDDAPVAPERPPIPGGE